MSKIKNLVFTFSLLYCFAFNIEGAKILGIFHVPSYSHYQLCNKIITTLASRGHDVTVISPFLEKNPPKNFKQIYLNGEVEKFKENMASLYERDDASFFSNVLWYGSLGEVVTNDTLSHPNLQDFLKTDQKFDLVIMEHFVNEAFRGFCYRFQAPCIILNPIGPGRWSNLLVANPGPPSYVPDMLLNYDSKMNFLQRFHNSIATAFAEIYFHASVIPRQNDLLAKYFPGAPHIYDLLYNSSLVLVNGHVSVNSPVPLVPNMIDIAGFHVNEPEPLPKDLQEYLDNSKDGVIYFSMGSNLKSKDMPQEKIDAILKSFAKLKQNVLWKFEDETLSGKPSNVKLMKWVPQQSVLAHPNIKLFISHGGLLSTIETIHFGVPIVGVPVFGDQSNNIANAQLFGYALKIPYKTLNEEKLTEALTEILNNSKYAKVAQARSKIMHDQPQKPLDKAIFWIEYVLRHNGAHHLRTAAIELAWYQYLLLDVVAVVVFLLLLLYKFFAVLIRLIINDNNKKIYVMKNKKKL